MPSILHSVVQCALYSVGGGGSAIFLAGPSVGRSVWLGSGAPSFIFQSATRSQPRKIRTYVAFVRQFLCRGLLEEHRHVLFARLGRRELADFLHLEVLIRLTLALYPTAICRLCQHLLSYFSVLVNDSPAFLQALLGRSQSCL